MSHTLPLDLTVLSRIEANGRRIAVVRGLQMFARCERLKIRQDFLRAHTRITANRLLGAGYSLFISKIIPFCLRIILLSVGINSNSNRAWSNLNLFFSTHSNGNDG